MKTNKSMMNVMMYFGYEQFESSYEYYEGYFHMPKSHCVDLSDRITSFLL